ncbi:MAG: trehalose-6-phosphate synthase [Phycisphaerae bacterium]|nr:trehalose-6-phosphate synthase [Phycisphaerae bacterium]
MKPLVRFIVLLVALLALLAWGMSRIVNDTTQAWFEKDIALRAMLAVNGARTSLVRNWPVEPDAGDRQLVRAILDDITHDERILAAAACNVDGTLIAATDDYPDAVSCVDFAARVDERSALGQDPEFSAVGMEMQLPTGPAHVSAIRIADAGKPLGCVILIHDLTFIARREARAQTLILAAFALLAICASLTTLVAARLAWRGWTKQVVRFIRGGTSRSEFQPIMRDVRELIERISAERALDAEGGAWTPQRLKHTLTQHLHGERVIMLANREPYVHNRSADGVISVLHPASGLVTAMEPVMRACSGVWVAHGSGSADRDTVDAHDRVRVPPGEESYEIRRVWLTKDDEEGYYYGFSNEGLWPLCHIADARPTFRKEDWERYQSVNQKFADTVCDEALRDGGGDDPIVFVQDYHFALAPRMIRERLPKATIIAFWHIPWPNAERFGICPWATQILEGLLGSSIVGFHTQLFCNNFLDAADRYLESRVDREHFAVIQQGRSALVRPYPISIEWPNRWADALPSAAECRRSVLDELALPDDALLGVGVDRIDYTKGIEERLLAVERMLERHPNFLGRFRFIQLGAPSRTVIERYRQLNETVAATAERINKRFGAGLYQPILFLRAHHEPATVFRYYRAADVCYVSSLHDGMNLVAKEFIAARNDERGVLVLSSFTGASRELTEALIVNPYHLDEAADALATALTMPWREQQSRMRAMRAIVTEFNVYRWAGRMLTEAAQLRMRERLRRGRE